ncbi:MAG: hypothetical protein MI975_10155 [Cytophagales bacterium]|nr:hypothetical protein [Cytophagales bacterium]
MEKKERLQSLDILRGFDLFCLVAFQPVLKRFLWTVDSPFSNWLASGFSHVRWEGFVFWDLIMPLFMFMAGVSMPFAFKKYLGFKPRIYKRIFKRVVILFIFGMMCQGNLLAFDIDKIYFYSNTLQAIAIGYLIAAIFLLHLEQKGQIIATSVLFVLYWTALTFVKMDGGWGGNFNPDTNIAEYIDRMVLGRFRDGSKVTGSGIDYGTYRYTWIISSLNFGVTVMTGVFAGQILKSGLSGIKKVQWLVIGGGLMILTGQLLSFQMPIIKKIWSSSMTLYSSGICFLLMALFYYVVDYLKYDRYLNWLKVYGMNSIAAYMIFEVFDFHSISEALFHGTAQFLGAYYNTLINLSNALILFLILWMMYKQKKFLKV